MAYCAHCKLLDPSRVVAYKRVGLAFGVRRVMPRDLDGARRPYTGQWRSRVAQLPAPASEQPTVHELTQLLARFQRTEYSAG